MWFIFPQFLGLGESPTARRYAIKNLDEARAYLAHPGLGARLVQFADAMLKLSNKSAREILELPDDLKLRSCATLFALVLPPGSVFEQLLDRFFNGKPDERTVTLTNSTEHSVEEW